MTKMIARRIDGRLYLEVTDELASRLGIDEGDAVLASDSALAVSKETEQERDARLLALGLQEMDRYTDTFRALAQ